MSRRTPMLGDCSTGTRLHLQSPLPTDDDLGLVPTVEQPLGARAVRAIAAGYAAIAQALALPIVVDAPTWWARVDRLERAGRDPDDIDGVMAACVAAVAPLRERDVYLGATIGPSTDGYRPGEVDPRTAEAYHRRHVEALAEQPLDVVTAATFSTVPDLAAAAAALAATDLPYVLGPVIDAEGRLADGVPLGEAVDRVESSVARPPTHWALCCTHPRVAVSALTHVRTVAPDAHDRVRQIKGNGSEASAEARETAGRVLSDEPEPWAETTLRLHDEHAVTILGGCCGTDDRHLLSIGLRLADPG